MPVLQGLTPLQVAGDAVRRSCLRAEDGGLLLDVGALRQVAFVTIRGASAVLAGGDRLNLLDREPHDDSEPSAVRRWRLPTAGRLVVLAGAGFPSPSWVQAAPAVSGLTAAAAAERLRAFAGEVQAPGDAVVLFELTAASTGRSGRRRF